MTKLRISPQLITPLPLGERVQLSLPPLPRAFVFKHHFPSQTEPPAFPGEHGDVGQEGTAWDGAASRGGDGESGALGGLCKG